MSSLAVAIIPQKSGDVVQQAIVKPPRKKEGHLKYIRKNWLLMAMLLPGLLVLLLNNYLPMFGVVLAFVRFKLSSGGFIHSLLTSPWTGFKNFEFFTKTTDAYVITRNTILYNLSFIALNLLTSIPAAIGLSEMRNKRTAKFYQSSMFLPHFLSWVTVSYLVFSLLSMNLGFINKSILGALGIAPVYWYNEPRYWPYIIIIVQVWKTLGYNSVIYLAAITGINDEYYEAAVIDGAGKFKQSIYITIPELIPLMITLTLLQLGRIFNADFGLFYQVPMNAGMLFPVTAVIDTYAYNALRVMGNTGMSAAVGLYQAVVGFVLVVSANLLVRKLDRDSALF